MANDAKIVADDVNIIRTDIVNTQGGLYALF